MYFLILSLYCTYHITNVSYLLLLNHISYHSSYNTTLYLTPLPKRIRSLPIKHLITRHHGNQILRLAQVNNIMCPSRDHIDRLDLIPAYFIHHIIATGILRYECHHNSKHNNNDHRNNRTGNQCCSGIKSKSQKLHCLFYPILRFHMYPPSSVFFCTPHLRPARIIRFAIYNLIGTHSAIICCFLR